MTPLRSKTERKHQILSGETELELKREGTKRGRERKISRRLGRSVKKPRK